MMTHPENHRIVTTPGVVGGKPRITGRRITVQDIVIWHEWLGRSADEISAEYSLDLADVYAALMYYYEHQADVDRTIRAREDFVAALKQHRPSKLAARLVIAAHGRSAHQLLPG
jgi:uncharacterized protein (DUF433 family)